MLSTRARRLTEELIKIGANVPVFDCPDVTQEDETKMIESLFKTEKQLKQEKKLRDKQNRNADHALDLLVVIEKLKTLSGVAEVIDPCSISRNRFRCSI